MERSFVGSYFVFVSFLHSLPDLVLLMSLEGSARLGFRGDDGTARSIVDLFGVDSDRGCLSRGASSLLSGRGSV